MNKRLRLLGGILLCMGIMLDNSGAGSAAPLQHYDSTELTVPVKTAEIRQISNVVYRQVNNAFYGNMSLKMDILQPKTNEAKPAVIFVTGGGFLAANKDNCIQWRMALAEAGYVVASIDYRVAPVGTFPEPIEDVKAAVRSLRANAERFGIDKQRIGLLGNSAGGYLVSFAGVTNGLAEYDKGDNLNESSAVQAVADIYGITDLTSVAAGYSKAVQEQHQSAAAIESLFVDGSPLYTKRQGSLQNPAIMARLNPLNHLSAETPPFLLMHGDADTVVSPQQTDIFYQALRRKNIMAKRYVIKGANHGGAQWMQPEVLRLLVKFFDSELKNKKTL